MFPEHAPPQEATGMILHDVRAGHEKSLKRKTRRALWLPSVACALVATLFAGCLSDSDDKSTPTGGVNLTLVLERVGALAKTSDISLRMVYLTASTPGADTLRDSVVLSGNGQQSVQRQFLGLIAGRIWTVSAMSKDQKNVTIHGFDTSFTVNAGNPQNVTLMLAARHSMLKARIFPVPDSVTTVRLFVNGASVAESTFVKQSLAGDTVILAYDYLLASRPGTSNIIKIEADGFIGNSNPILLYQGDTTIQVVAGVNAAHAFRLGWVGPSQGRAALNVVLGAIGNLSVDWIMPVAP